MLVVHGVNSAFEIFAVTRDGQKLPSAIPTKIYTADIMSKMGYEDPLFSSDPNAYYDLKEDRYVLAWSSFYLDPSQPGDEYAPLFVCVSADSNPLSMWNCWALYSYTFTPDNFCAGRNVSDFIADYPQVGV